MVEILVSCWDGNFSGAMLVLARVMEIYWLSIVHRNMQTCLQESFWIQSSLISYYSSWSLWYLVMPQQVQNNCQSPTNQQILEVNICLMSYINICLDHSRPNLPKKTTLEFTTSNLTRNSLCLGERVKQPVQYKDLPTFLSQSDLPPRKFNSSPLKRHLLKWEKSPVFQRPIFQGRAVKTLGV